MSDYETATMFVKCWAGIDNPYARRRAAAWWYKREAIRYGDPILREVSDMLIDMTDIIQ